MTTKFALVTVEENFTLYFNRGVMANQWQTKKIATKKLSHAQ